MNDGGVIIAYLHPGEVSYSFMRSLMGLMSWDLTHGQVLRGFEVEECGAARIIEGRNSAVRRFLRTDAEWLLFIDSDMGFEANALDRLLAVADPVERPVVGALCFGQRKGPESVANSRMLTPVPTIYKWVDGIKQAGFAPVYDYPKNRLVQCDGTGSAFILVHRSVYEKLNSGAFPFPREWYDDTIYKGQVFGEDLTFCKRVTELGIPIHVDTSVRTSHYKHTYLEEGQVGDITHAPTYVVIPFKDRMDLTGPLLADLRRIGGWDGIFLMDNGSKRPTKNWLSTIDDPSIVAFNCEGMNLHQMWNLGMAEACRRSWRCNVTFLNNDLRLGDDMLDKLATALRSDPLLAVVSPNYDGRDGSGVEYTDQLCAGRYDGTGGLAGFAFMLRGESNYRFPEDLNWWFGDTDMLMSVLHAGSMAGLVLDATVEHVDGGSQTGDWAAPEMQALLEQDRQWFAAKWLPEREEVA